MAQELAIPGAGTTAKIRNPLGVLGLGLITLGIYHVFWWYFVNREMADLGRANRRPELGDNPIMSVLAVTIGALIIVPLFVSFWRTLKRIETSQNLVLGSNNLAVVLVFILGKRSRPPRRPPERGRGAATHRARRAILQAYPRRSTCARHRCDSWAESSHVSRIRRSGPSRRLANRGDSVLRSPS